MLYLKIYNSKDEMKMFGFWTRYNFYDLKINKFNDCITQIKDEKEHIVYLMNLNCYPIIILNISTIYYIKIIWKM